MRYHTVDPRLIAANPWNTNIVSHENEEKLRASIERHGFFRPVVVRELPDGSLQSLGGWHRVEQAIELGLDEVPVANVGQVDDDRAKEISLLDNARYGTDDAIRLAQLVGELNVDLSTIMPWTSADLDGFTASLGVTVDDLDLDDLPTSANDHDDEPLAGPTKPVKTHEILRFKVTLADAAKARSLVGDVMRTQGFSDQDDLSNAGDALMHILTQGGVDAEGA